MPTDANSVSARILDVLCEAGVLTTSPRGRYETTATFERAVEEHLGDEGETPSESRLLDTELIEQLGEERLLARLTALSEFVAADLPGDDATETLVHLSFALDQFADDAPPSDGSPAGFLPVRAEWIDSVARTYPAAVVYFWREDCPPCDDVKNTLESIAAERAGEVGLVAVYGPDSARMLQTRYNVVGAPTTLFFCNGRIDSRIQGARTPTVFRKEVATIHERAGSRDGDEQ